MPPSTREIRSMIRPRRETICIGAAEKEEILETAYLISDQVDHFVSPTSRSRTSNSTEVVLNPIQEDRARKKAFFSRIFKRAFTAFRSRSLKSEARDISTFVRRLMIL